ncbi:MAG TPA: hypothetical protein VFH06_03525 [Candidatus Saccharimonadales bacterium]|nr:hypothetical protein [Candidatus Saccharimonadales bacterium]
MDVRFASLQEIRSGALDWGGHDWGDSSFLPISIDPDAFESFVRARAAVFHGTLHYLDPFMFKAFGQDAWCRPLGSEKYEEFNEKSLAFCEVNDQEYVLFIIEKYDGRWAAAQELFGIANDNPVHASDEDIRSIFSRLTES